MADDMVETVWDAERIARWRRALLSDVEVFWETDQLLSLLDALESAQARLAERVPAVTSEAVWVTSLWVGLKLAAENALDCARGTSGWEGLQRLRLVDEDGNLTEQGRTIHAALSQSADLAALEQKAKEAEDGDL